MGVCAIYDDGQWNEQIALAASTFGLDFYPQEFELLDKEEFFVYRVHLGLPLLQPYWRFSGKEQIFSLSDCKRFFNEKALYALPQRAYLLRENTLSETLFAMIHLYAYNDFVKRNKIFRTIGDGRDILRQFDGHHQFIQSCMENEKIGSGEVEKILAGAHAARFQGNQLLHFMMEQGNLSDWQKELLKIVEKETHYFLPQLETMIMAEGWAGYWYEKILNQLALPDELREECKRMHNVVFYRSTESFTLEKMAYMLFKKIDETYGPKEIFQICQRERDVSFVERYFDWDIYRRLKGAGDLQENGRAEKDAWEMLKKNLLDVAGQRRIPMIRVNGVRVQDGTLLLEHLWDYRELQQEYVFEFLKHMVNLWGNKVMIKTKFNNINKLVLCNECKSIAIKTEGK
ncbi:SpoVR family protein [Thermotalea metallivorans]|uniref:SpoVR family protein n=1 Tax=Thermotalea metallivorans TaxID=520762 RepID=A0A140LEL9_9FIRM|nr:SpoVR family protein [Thermotalea metallivorans]KXG78994.1 hypothetical protein AN619_00240 [Thermotalea metallivorans]